MFIEKKYKDNKELAEVFADRFAHLINEMKDQERINVLLSGGNTPKQLFQNLSKYYNNRIPWEKVHLYWGDERCVPNNHKESNYNMTKKNLIYFVDIPNENVHRIIGENKPELEAVRYSAEIRNNVPLKANWPVFDIVLLGIGTDGHTASIFPNNIKIINSDSVCKAVRHPNTGQQRITVTGKVINNAKYVIFLVSGSNKAVILDKIINKKQGYENYPAANISTKHGVIEWYVDNDAAELI